MNRIIIGKNRDDPFLLAGTTMNNRYIVDKKISNGSSGCIILAKDLITNNQVVLKISSANNYSIKQLVEEGARLNILIIAFP